MNGPIPDSDHVVRYCKPSQVDDGVPSPAAFLPRRTEGYLSVNWLEFFGALSRLDAVERVREAFRGKDYEIKHTGRMAVLNVGEAKTAARDAGRPVRVEHVPEPDDASHAGVMGYATSDVLVGEALQSLVMRSGDLHPGEIIPRDEIAAL